MSSPSYLGIEKSCIIRFTLREKCPYSELFWSVFYCFQFECKKIWTRKTRNEDSYRAVFV